MTGTSALVADLPPGCLAVIFSSIRTPDDAEGYGGGYSAVADRMVEFAARPCTEPASSMPALAVKRVAPAGSSNSVTE